MLIAIPVGAGNLWRLRHQPRTPTPEPWVAEVEQALFDVAPAQIDHVRLFLAVDDVSGDIGAFSVYPHPNLACEYLSALAVFHDRRGERFGRAVLDLALSTTLSVSTLDHVMWVVDNHNAAMLRVSRTITALPGRSHPDETRGPTTSWFIVDRA